MRVFRRYGAATILAGLLLIALGAQAAAQEAALPTRQSFVTGVQQYDQGVYRDVVDDATGQVKEEGAVTLLTRATTEDAKFEPAWFYLGLAHWRTGNLQEANKAFQQALTLTPDRVGTRYYLGRILEEAAGGDVDILNLALQQYVDELRLRRGRDVVEVLNALGRVYYQAGRPRDAIAQLERCLAMESNYVEAYYNLGRALDARGEHEEAASTFRRAKEILAEWQDALQRLQRLQAENRRDPTISNETVQAKYGLAAQFAMERQLWPELNLALGDTEDRRKDYAAARNAYREAAEPSQLGNPDDARVPTRVGLAYLHDAQELFFQEHLIYQPVGVLKAAQKEFQRALALNPNLAEAHNGLGEVYLMEADNFVPVPSMNIAPHFYPDAETEFQAALQQYPQYVDAMVNLARTELGHAQSIENERARGGQPAGDPAALRNQAVTNLRRAAELAPGRADVHGQLAWALVDTGQPAEARQESLLATQLDRNEVTAYLADGLAAYYSNTPALAANSFRRATELQPDRYEPHRFLGDALFQLQSWARAREEYRLALQYLPEAHVTGTAWARADTLRWIALTYSNTGLHDRAIETLREALSLDPQYFEARRQIARDYQAMGQWEAAAEALETAAETGPGPMRADTYCQLGQLREAQGKPHEAIAAYTQALTLDAEHLEARRGLERLGPGGAA